MPMGDDISQWLHTSQRTVRRFVFCCRRTGAARNAYAMQIGKSTMLLQAKKVWNEGLRVTTTMVAGKNMAHAA
jgi:hypothetical protein